MKQIVAWVNKYDKKQLEKYTTKVAIYFATSLSDFNQKLNGNVFPLFSLGLAGRTLLQTRDIIQSHSNLCFYFLDKRVHQWTLTDPDWKVRNPDNTERLVISHREAIQIAESGQLPGTLQERIAATQG